MTTLVRLKVKCPQCNETFRCIVTSSFGFRGIDRQGCREYWGMNPMQYQLVECPFCEHIDWYYGYEKLEGEPEDSLVENTPSCDSYMKFAENLIKSGAESSIIAFTFQQGGCCKRMNGEDPKTEFQRALEYFRKAKEEGVKPFDKLSIDN
ncbi:MAG: DUF2225 domain-containing protein [Candidatus Thorarchaeota archaeon]|nr:DUF2225 domain-containing protein [Candidatus Thorarchaeota archaeon]